MIVKDLNDFNLLIMPVFYLIHGEKYDTMNLNDSYRMKMTKQHYLSITCSKCDLLRRVETQIAGSTAQDRQITFRFEFIFSSKNDVKSGDFSDAYDIRLAKRGQIFHALHYEDYHSVQGL